MSKDIALHRDQGASIWMLGHLMTFKATGADTGGAFSLIEQVGAPGTGAPPHIHHGEDEFFYVLEGEATFTLGDQTIEGKAGTFVFLPRDVIHHFQNVGTQPCRMLIGLSPAVAEGFFREMGEPAPASLELPPPAAPDIDKLLMLSRKYNVEVLLPDAPAG
jgi:quercetin dioxygenase-like cupin family protein